MLRQRFPNFLYAEPANEDLIQSAEERLGLSLPMKLKVLYLECNGFREDLGHAPYLFPLFGNTSLVELTSFLWSEFEGAWAGFSLREFIFFGSSCCDNFFGVAIGQPFELIQFHHHMEGALEAHGTDIIEMYARDYIRFGRADAV